MEIASASATLASGTIPNQWPDIAAMRKGDLASNELESLTQAMEAFISRLSCQLESLRDRLRDAGFVFALPDHTLRAATVGDLAALDAFIEKYGSVPLSVEAWYRQIASFSFGQDGSQMFDRSHGFYFMHRFHQFTMPPVATACTSRWDDMIGWEGDDKEHLTDEGKVFFMMEECGMDEDWYGFGLPDDSVDPVLDTDTGITFLQWAQFQIRWGGFGPLDEALKRGETDGVSNEFVERVFHGTE